jgi:uncharacterized damage-inducible protein DinB
MTVKDLQMLFDYGYWANRKVFDVVSQLTTEEYTRAVAGSYGSVRNTLVHIMSAEWGWLDRCGGPQRGPALNAADYPTFAVLRDQWTKIEDHMRTFLAALRDEDLDRIVEFTLGPTGKRAMPVGELLHHAANHAVHHRGQVALLLRALGHAPGNFDVLFYYGEQQRVAAS